MWDRRDPTEKEDGDMAMSTSNILQFLIQKSKISFTPLTPNHEISVRYQILPLTQASWEERESSGWKASPCYVTY